MSASHIFYAQSGGPTAVINASACGVIEAARQYKDQLGRVYAGKNGILGALNEEWIDTSLASDQAIQSLMHTPSSAFGSCRFKLKNLTEDKSQYLRLIEVFRAHDIGYFFYNGGGDSQDTVWKVSQMAEQLGYPLTCIGIPKTIDNDLPWTDCSPGFGSVAKYVAISTQEAAWDVRSMAATSTKVFILEVMGRHTGWIAASAGLINQKTNQCPLLILFPETPFCSGQFLKQVKQKVSRYGYCVIVASEGIRDLSGQFLSESGTRDAFGHHQLGGVAPLLAQKIQNQLGYKNHWSVADYLQRAARHIASKTDLQQAYAVGKSAVEMALAGENNRMVTIERVNHSPYRWQIANIELSKVANQEKALPQTYMSDDGFGITPACLEYLKPLIQGEAYPPYQNGLPDYVCWDIESGS